MKSWLILLAGLLIWAVHFFLLYGIGEFAGEGRGTRIAVGVLTLFGLTLIGWLAQRFAHIAPGDDFARWRMFLARTGLAISALAVAWQGLPALLST